MQSLPPRRGVTLTEILVAVAVLSFALLPLMGFLRTGGRGVTGTRDIAAAAYLASQALEELRAWTFEELAEEDPPNPEGRPSAEARMNAEERARVEISGIRFEREVEVVPLADAAGPPAKLATVTVRWTRGETPLHYQVTTVIPRAP